MFATNGKAAACLVTFLTLKSIFLLTFTSCAKRRAKRPTCRVFLVFYWMVLLASAGCTTAMFWIDDKLAGLIFLIYPVFFLVSSIVLHNFLANFPPLCLENNEKLMPADHPKCTCFDQRDKKD
jgi:hypothetical protein